MEEAEEQNQMAMGASSLEVVASCSEADLDPFAFASASASASASTASHNTTITLSDRCRIPNVSGPWKPNRCLSYSALMENPVPVSTAQNVVSFLFLNIKYLEKSMF